MQKLLTISVAAYHVESYLPETLDSFLIPKVQEQLEVFIINDGSGEEINEIARKYVEKYPQVFTLIDKENGGHGSTVNRGIEEASGKYFKTVDGDDRVEAEGFADLLTYLENATEDLIVTDYYRFDDETGEWIDTIRHGFDGKKYGTPYAFEDICNEVYINMHAATFRTELLKKMKRRLDEHCFYVDTEYMLYPIPFVKTVTFLKKPVYEYRLGVGFQSVEIRNMQKNCSHHEMVLSHLLDFYRDECASLAHRKRRYVERGVARVLVSQFKIYLSFEPDRQWKKKIKNLDKRIKREFPGVYQAVENSAVKWLRKSGYHIYPLASRACRKAYHCE